MKAAVKYSVAGALAVLFCTGMFFLYRNVRQEQAQLVCGRLDVSFVDSLRFVSEQDVREYLDAHYGSCVGQRLDSLQLARIEEMLESRSSVTRCEAWTSDDGVLHIEIAQRAPVLRFQDGNRGFYVDAEGYIFPLHPTYTAPVPVVDGAIPVQLPADYKGQADDPYARNWIDGVLTMHRFISTSRNWQRGITHIKVRPGGDLVLSLQGRDELFVVGQPENIPDKLGRIDRYIGLIAPSKPEGYYKTVNVKYNQQIICRQKDT